VNREQGSGSRTATDLYFTGDHCTIPLQTRFRNPRRYGDYFSTGNVLAAANTIPGAITYASIDNAAAATPT